MQSLPSPQDQRSPHHWTVDTTCGLYFLDIIRQRKVAPVQGGGGSILKVPKNGAPLGDKSVQGTRV